MAEKVIIKIDKNMRISQLPAIALRGLVVFPNNSVHFEVGREKSVAAIEWAMENNSSIFLVTQKDLEKENPTKEQLFPYGVVCDVKQVLRVSDTLVKILVEGKFRAKLNSIEQNGKFLVANIKYAPVKMPKETSAEELEALVRTLKDAFEEYLALNARLPKDVVYTIFTSEDPMFLSEYIPTNMLFKYSDKQLILNENTLVARLSRLVELFKKENRIISIEKEIQDKVNDQMEKNQRDYYLREQMRAITSELDDEDNTKVETDNYLKKIEQLNLSEEVNTKLCKEANRLLKMQGTSQEAGVIRTYLDTCLELPWNTFTLDDLDINKAEKILDKDHFGMKKVKERILELLAVRKLASDVKGQIICFVGPPGVGKTSIAKAIATCLNRKYARMSLGGVRDEAEIRGHRRTYIGAMPGKIVSAITQSKSKNPLILLDEIDKLSHDFRGDPASALLEALDPEQNKDFKDHYLDIPFNLSDVLFITTANTTDTIPAPLLDRMDVIELSSYTRLEKFNIAKKHLVAKCLTQNGLKGLVKISDGAIYELIEGYTHEAGVRGLERAITELLRKCARVIASGKQKTVSVTEKSVFELIGPRRNKPNFSNKNNAVGIANGLAWTSHGGVLLPIEVQIIEKGSGKLELTGSLGDVMKESAKLAITYAKVNAEFYGYDAEALSKVDLHIHAPEGAIPKDGPSAGVTLGSALVSALSKYEINSNFAMTGEITLHGIVLPIGGLKEKSMAAFKEGIKNVIIPKDNLPDLYEIDDAVKNEIKFYPVSTLAEVLNLVLIKNKNIRKSKVVHANLIEKSEPQTLITQ